jgi:hypothetical protein
MRGAGVRWHNRPVRLAIGLWLAAVLGCGEDRSPCERAEELCHECELDVAGCARFDELLVQQCEAALGVYEERCLQSSLYAPMSSPLAHVTEPTHLEPELRSQKLSQAGNSDSHPERCASKTNGSPPSHGAVDRTGRPPPTSG